MTSQPQTPRSDLPALAGLDVGTSRIKCLIVDAEGRTLARCDMATPCLHLKSGWTDYDPEALWQSSCEVIKAAVARLPSPRAVRGIAVASVAESAVPVDASGRPLDRAIAWFDLRTTGEYENLVRLVGSERLHTLSGLKPDPIFGLCKLLWFRSHRPDQFKRLKRWLNVADYIAFRLCGVMATDYSLACRTMAYNLFDGGWDWQLLQELNLEPEVFAKLQASGTPLERISPDAAEATGLSPEVFVGVGGHDHIVGAFGSGSLQPGVTLDSLGTSEALLLTLDQPVREPTTVACGLSQGLLGIDRFYYYLVGGLYSSGGTIEWFRRTFGAALEREQLMALATRAKPGQVLFLPHLARSLTPHPDDSARAAFLGLTAETTFGEFFRAVLEGLAFEARHALDTMVHHAGLSSPGSIRVIGHNAENAAMMELKATIFGQSLEVCPVSEATCFGAALLAGLASGVFPDVPAALSAVPASNTRITPDEERCVFYEDLYQTCYRELYETLRLVNHRLAKVVQWDL